MRYFELSTEDNRLIRNENVDKGFIEELGFEHSTHVFHKYGLRTVSPNNIEALAVIAKLSIRLGLALSAKLDLWTSVPNTCGEIFMFLGFE